MVVLKVPPLVVPGSVTVVVETIVVVDTVPPIGGPSPWYVDPFEGKLSETASMNPQLFEPAQASVVIVQFRISINGSILLDGAMLQDVSQ